MIKRLLFIFSWFFTAGIVLGANLLALSVIFKKEYLPIIPSTHSQVSSAASELPLSPPPGTSHSIGSQDARPEIVANFLKRHNAQLKPHDYYGKKLVEIADKNNLDFRLLPAIAMQESNLCKAIPPGSYNCLGLGVHSKGTWGFDSFEANFEAAAKILSENYVGKGLTTPEEIMKKYTPGSNGSWANSVNQWIAEMEYNDKDLGKSMKSDADLLQYAQRSTQ